MCPFQLPPFLLLPNPGAAWRSGRRRQPGRAGSQVAVQSPDPGRQGPSREPRALSHAGGFTKEPDAFSSLSRPDRKIDIIDESGPGGVYVLKTSALYMYLLPLFTIIAPNPPVQHHTATTITTFKCMVIFVLVLSSQGPFGLRGRLGLFVFLGPPPSWILPTYKSFSVTVLESSND